MNHIDEIATRLHGSQYFSTLDANKGYFYVKLTEKSSQSCQPGQIYFRSDIVLYQEYVRSRARVRLGACVKHAHTNTNVTINNKTHILCKYILVSLTTDHQHNN